MAKKDYTTDNLEIHKDQRLVVASVNPKIYSLDTIISAAYILIDKAYVIVDGNPAEQIFIQLRAKDKKTDLEELGRRFNDELLNYAFYSMQSVRNQQVRAAIIQRAFLTQASAKKPRAKTVKRKKR